MQHKLKITIFLSVFTLGSTIANAQWVAQSSGTSVRLRGVSAVNSLVAWASGDKGTYARTLDGGLTWRTATVPGAAMLDFRDVDAFDEKTAYLLSIGEGEKSRIYKTIDGGSSWMLQFKSNRPSAFFDAMAFWDRDHGIALSDPVDGRFLIITTSDGGATWKEMPSAQMPLALAGEGAFAASGTCITVQGKTSVWFGTGSPMGARVFHSIDGGRTWTVASTPLISGKTAGVFSIVFRDAKRGVAVGGDYTKEQVAERGVALTLDGGKSWRLIKGPGPNGYRSCVAIRAGMSTRMLVATGPSGSEYSLDGGESWVKMGEDGFHSVSFAASSSAGWAVGENGRISRYTRARR